MWDYMTFWFAKSLTEVALSIAVIVSLIIIILVWVTFWSLIHFYERQSFSRKSRAYQAKIIAKLDESAKSPYRLEWQSMKTYEMLHYLLGDQPTLYGYPGADHAAYYRWKREEQIVEKALAYLIKRKRIRLVDNRYYSINEPVPVTGKSA